MDNNHYAVLENSQIEDKTKRWRVGHFEDHCWITDLTYYNQAQAEEFCRDLNTYHKAKQLRRAELKAIGGLISDAESCFADDRCTASITLSLLAIAKALALQLERVD